MLQLLKWKQDTNLEYFRKELRRILLIITMNNRIKLKGNNKAGVNSFVIT
jgi:hypothetical protein